MRKRVPFLALAIILTVAPSAMANHCEKCIGQNCVDAANFGYLVCVEGGGDPHSCQVSSPCGPHVQPEPLAAELTVVSVERLDEPDGNASETLVASLDTPERTNR